MTTVKSAFQELIALTHSALSQEAETNKWIFTSRETCDYFRQFALTQKNKNNPLPAAPKPAPILKPPKPEPVPEPASEPKPVSVELAKKQQEPFKLDPIAAAQPHDLNDIKKILVEKFPSQPILDEIPKPEPVKLRTLSVVILSFSPKASETKFLHSLADAVTNHLGYAKVVDAEQIEKQQAWDRLLKSTDIKLIIAADDGLYSYPELMQRHSCDQESAKHYLGDKPLIMLARLDHYESQPELKRALWKSIQKHYEKSL